MRAISSGFSRAHTRILSRRKREPVPARVLSSPFVTFFGLAPAFALWSGLAPAAQSHPFCTAAVSVFSHSVLRT
jgi:hypothetical protein